MSASPERVLMVSKDRTLLANPTGFGDTLKRHILYAELLRARRPESDIRILTYSPYTFSQQRFNPVPGLRIYGTGSRHRALYSADALALLESITVDGWRPTVVTVQEPWEAGLVGFLAARRWGARFIPQVHFDLFAQDWLRESWTNRPKFWIACYLLRQADQVRAVSTVQQRKLVESLKLPPEAVHVVPVGVNFEPTTESQLDCRCRLLLAQTLGPVVLFVGRLCAQKNLPLWVTVAEQILAELPTAQFLIAGDGPLRGDIEAQVQSKGLQSAVVFLGSVAYSALPEVFGAADVLLLTSHYEGFGRVVVEAQMARLPVVATACTGPEDIIVDGQTGYLCEPGDQSGLAAAVLTLLKDEAKRSSLAAAGQRRVATLFDKKRLAEQLVEAWITP
ncbi:MAG: glycosyltransferase family 4 protein [Cyanobacteria bacterium J06627_15]